MTRQLEFGSVIFLDATTASDREQLLGRYELGNAGVTFAYGPLTRAMREGLGLVVENAQALTPDARTLLEQVKATRVLDLPEHDDEVIHAHDAFDIEIVNRSR